MRIATFDAPGTLSVVPLIFFLSACVGSGGGTSAAAGSSANVPISIAATTVAAGETFVFTMGGQIVSVTQNAVKTAFPPSSTAD